MRGSGLAGLREDRIKVGFDKGFRGLSLIRAGFKGLNF
jgi:hypothetical protein